MIGADGRAGYFDYNGSTPVHPEVRERCARHLAGPFGNPSAAHPAGRAARAEIDAARAAIARFLGAGEDEIAFTSGGTESNNWALTGTLRASGKRHLVVSAIEHKSVLRTAEALAAEGVAVDLAPVDAAGRVDVGALDRLLRPDTALVSVMTANNETGVVQPIAEVGALCRRRGVPFHTDAVCAIGRLPLDVGRLGCDLLSLSSHKLYAPKGGGVLYLRRGHPIAPLIHGCGQQDGRRGGTENALPLLGFAAAIELLQGGRLPPPQALLALRQALERGLAERFPAARVNGGGERLCNTVNVHFPGHLGHALQEALGRCGISVAAGPAAAGSTPSHVLLAMGCTPEHARSSVRFSLGSGTDAAGVERCLAALEEAIGVAPLASEA